jgi:hypothetical protein
MLAEFPFAVPSESLQQMVDDGLQTITKDWDKE